MLMGRSELMGMVGRDFGGVAGHICMPGMDSTQGWEVCAGRRVGARRMGRRRTERRRAVLGLMWRVLAPAMEAAERLGACLGESGRAAGCGLGTVVR